MCDKALGEVADELGEVTAALGKLNRNIEKYLDWIEVVDPPSPPEDFICSWCMADIVHPEYYRRCQHGVLCAACAPCDECPPERE